MKEFSLISEIWIKVCLFCIICLVDLSTVHNSEPLSRIEINLMEKSEICPRLTLWYRWLSVIICLHGNGWNKWCSMIDQAFYNATPYPVASRPRPAVNIVKQCKWNKLSLFFNEVIFWFLLRPHLEINNKHGKIHAYCLHVVARI